MAQRRRKSKEPNKLVWQIPLTVLIFVGVVTGIYFAKKPESQESAGDHMVACTLSGDADCMLHYTTVSEQYTLGLDATKMKSLLDNVVKPGLAGLKASGPVQVHQDGGIFTVVQPLKAPDGRATVINYEVDSMGSGPQTPDVELSLIMMTARAAWPGDKPFPDPTQAKTPEEKKTLMKAQSRFYADAISKMVPSLTATGIDGVLEGVPPAEDHLSWTDLLASNLSIVGSKFASP